MGNRIELCSDVKIVKDALTREIVGENVREEWKDFIIETDRGKSKIYKFRPDASITVKAVFSLLQYFPLLFPKDKKKIKTLFSALLKSQ